MASNRGRNREASPTQAEGQSHGSRERSYGSDSTTRSRDDVPRSNQPPPKIPVVQEIIANQGQNSGQSQPSSNQPSNE